MADREFMFTGGMPDPGSFPTEPLIEAAARALRREGGDTFVRYPGDQGNIALREVAAARFNKSQDAAVSPGDVAITNGSMQSLDLIIRALVAPGDTVLTEELSYMGTLGALRHRRARLVGVPVDEDGMDTAALEVMLRDLKAQGVKPALINTVPVNHNPTGAHLSAERKQRLIELAAAHDVVILEDECYGDIYFDATPPKSLYATAEPGRVIYVSTFSKTIGPGMRLGYMIAPPSLMRRALNERWDSGTSAFASVILAEYLKDHMWRHIRETNEIVRGKRDALIAALDDTLGSTATCRPPKGGLFAWVKLPEGSDMNALMSRLDARRVRCTRGQAFHVDRADIPNVRFSFGYPSHDDIRDGIAVFAECVKASQRSEAVAS